MVVALSLLRRHAAGSLLDYKLLFDLTGYGYVLAWSISFYPQLILNWRRKSTAGMSIGFQWYNMLGFMLYLIYTSFVPDCTVQDQIFAGHALFITACLLVQVPLYGVDKLGDFPEVHGKIVGGLLLLLDLVLVLNVIRLVSMLDLLYACGYLKTCISLVKYTPQIYLNFKRKSTGGFAMGMVFCDLTGGFLSIFQQFVSCAYDDSTSSVRPEWSWEPFSGNKPKCILGLIAIFYDCIFLYQHFALYGSGSPTAPRTPETTIRQPLDDATPIPPDKGPEPATGEAAATQALCGDSGGS